MRMSSCIDLIFIHLDTRIQLMLDGLTFYELQRVQFICLSLFHIVSEPGKKADDTQAHTTHNTQCTIFVPVTVSWICQEM